MWTVTQTRMEHVERQGRTVAPDSRHIVGFRLSNTTFRAADKFLSKSVSGVRVGVSQSLPRPGSGFCPKLPAATNAEELFMSWTDERVEMLKKLWADGLSASQIAAELGGITRNAVIGKVHRLGLSGRAKSPSSAAPRPRKARPHQHMMRVSRPAVRGNTALAHAYDLDAQAEPELVDNVVPMGQPLTLPELTEGTLPWPIGEPGQADFFFWSRRTITSLPYCAFHSRVAYQPPNMRRDRRPFRG